MTTATLPIQRTETYDVVVLGGGPTGCAAAAAAAREGAQTVLVEAGTMLGGSGTSALVPVWCPFSDRQQIIHRGIAETVLNRCKSRQPDVPKEQLDWVPIDPESLKRIYDDLLAEHGATVKFQTILSAVERDEEGRVHSIIVTNKRGLSRLAAKVFIDCTGDADLCAWAGAEFHKGSATGELMPATHCFVLGNVNGDVFRTKYENGRRLMGNHPQTPIYDIINSGRFPLINDAHVFSNLTGPNTVGFNAGHLWEVDNTNPETVSAALAMGRKQAAQFHEALAEFCPDAFGESFLVSTGTVIGVRETRRIIGDYELTINDYIDRKSFADEICRNAYFIDIHHSLKEAEEHTKNREDCLSLPMSHYQPGESHGIPYRCLTPKGLVNVLVAGRSISCDRPVQGSVRVMPVCLTMGEAAGIAAAYAAEEPVADVHTVDTQRLRRRLREAGGYLPEHASEKQTARVAG